jgi:hypothetical protein
MPIQQPVRVLSEHAEGPIDTVINPAVSKLEDATHTADETQQHEGQGSGSRFAVALWAGFVATLLVFAMQVVGLVSQSGGGVFRLFAVLYCGMGERSVCGGSSGCMPKLFRTPASLRSRRRDTCR